MRRTIVLAACLWTAASVHSFAMDDTADVPTTIEEVKGCPEAFTKLPFAVDLLYRGVGDIYNPFYTLFEPSTHLNFSAWSATAQVWTRAGYQDHHPLFYVRRKNERLQRSFLEMQPFTWLRARCIVRSTMGGRSWIEVLDVISSKPPMDSNDFRHLARGWAHVEAGEWFPAQVEFESINYDQVPPFFAVSAKTAQARYAMNLGYPGYAIDILRHAATYGVNRDQVAELRNEAEAMQSSLRSRRSQGSVARATQGPVVPPRSRGASEGDQESPEGDAPTTRPALSLQPLWLQSESTNRVDTMTDEEAGAAVWPDEQPAPTAATEAEESTPTPGTKPEPIEAPSSKPRVDPITLSGQDKHHPVDPLAEPTPKPRATTPAGTPKAPVPPANRSGTVSLPSNQTATAKQPKASNAPATRPTPAPASNPAATAVDDGDDWLDIWEDDSAWVSESSRGTAEPSSTVTTEVPEIWNPTTEPAPEADLARTPKAAPEDTATRPVPGTTPAVPDPEATLPEVLPPVLKPGTEADPQASEESSARVEDEIEVLPEQIKVWEATESSSQNVAQNPSKPGPVVPEASRQNPVAPNPKAPNPSPAGKGAVPEEDSTKDVPTETVEWIEATTPPPAPVDKDAPKNAPANPATPASPQKTSPPKTGSDSRAGAEGSGDPD